MKSTVAESNAEMELFTQQPFCFSPSVQAGDNKTPIMAVSAASHWATKHEVMYVND